MTAMTIDLTGLKCPMPALLAKKHMLRAAPGTVLTILCDDPMAAIDVPHMCHTEGFEVVAVAREGDCARILIRRP